MLSVGATSTPPRVCNGIVIIIQLVRQLMSLIPMAMLLPLRITVDIGESAPTAPSRPMKVRVNIGSLLSKCEVCRLWLEILSQMWPRRVKHSSDRCEGLLQCA